MTESTFLEVLRLPWPDGSGEMVQEIIYRVDNESGQVVPNGILAQEQRAALQALVNYRGPEARKPQRGNSLEEISSDSPEARLSHALSLALLSPENLRAYQQAEKSESIRDMVREAHRPVCFDPDFSVSDIDVLEDGNGLVQVSETGPNWTYRTTFYTVALTPEIDILEAYTPCGEHTVNYHFQTGPIWEEDESGRFDDFHADLARLWHDCPGWLVEGEATNE